MEPDTYFGKNMKWQLHSTSSELICPQQIKLHAGVKKCRFGNFSERAGMDFNFFFLLWVPGNAGRQNWKRLIILGFNLVKSHFIIMAI